jgi:superfamily II DNA/RNA helicase
VVQYRREEVSVVASFEESALSEKALKVLQLNGLKEPTPIQVQTIPVILAGEKDIDGQARQVSRKGNGDEGRW